MVCPSYGPASDATDVSFCSTSTGNINIGTGTRTTSNKFINIGNGAGSTNQINIGVLGVTTSIQGVLSTSLGTLSGKTSYFEHDTTTVLPTLDCSTVNLNVFILFFSGSTPSGTYTLSNIQDNQTFTFKNWTTQSTAIPIAFTTYSLYPYGIDNGTAGSPSISLARGNSIVIQRINGKLYQVTPNGNFPIGLSTTSLTATTSVTTPLITSSAALNIGTSTATSITIGASAITTTINGKLSTSIGVLSGNTAFYDNYASTFNIGTLTINRDFYFIANVGSTNITFPTPVIGQIISIRNLTTGTITITVGTGVSIFPTSGTGSGTSWTALTTNTAQRFYARDTISWIGF
jgi:hypothetical protein